MIAASGGLTAQVDWLDLRVGSHLVLFYSHQWPGQTLTMTAPDAVLSTIITIIIITNIYPWRWTTPRDILCGCADVRKQEVDQVQERELSFRKLQQRSRRVHYRWRCQGIATLESTPNDISINQSINQSITNYLEWLEWLCHCKIQWSTEKDCLKRWVFSRCWNYCRVQWQCHIFRQWIDDFHKLFIDEVKVSKPLL